MKTNRPVLNSDETFLGKKLDDLDSGKDFDSDVIPKWTNTFFGTTHRNFTEQWNDVKTRWHRNYGYLFSSNDSIQSSNPENTFQNQLYLSEERDVYDNSSSEASVITKEKAFNRRRRYVCVGVTIAVVLVLLACIISAVLIEVIFVPPRTDLAAQVRLSVRIINRNYTEELSNKSSESFQLLQKDFCSAVQRKVNEDTSCIVDSVKHGSLIVNIRLFTTSTTNAEGFAVTVVVIIKGDTQDGSSFLIGVFQISEIKSEGSNLVVQDTIPPTAIIHKKDENTSPSTTEITTSTVTTTSSLQSSPVEISSSYTELSSSYKALSSTGTPTSSLQPSPVEISSSYTELSSSYMELSSSYTELSSTKTSSSALQLESRSTEISPGLLESRSIESSVITSLLSLAETSSKMSEFSSNVESFLKSSYSESLHSSQQPSPSSTEMPFSTLQLEGRSTDMSSGLFESRSSESSARTPLLSLIETSSTMLELSSNLESLLESSFSESGASFIVSESFVSTLLPNSPETNPEMIKSSSTGSSASSNESPSSSPQPNLSETSSTTPKSSNTATSSKEESFPTVLGSSAAVTSSVMFESSSSSNEASSTMLEPSSPYTSSLMLESGSSAVATSNVMFESSSSPNEASSDMLKTSSIYTSPLMFESRSREVSDSSLQPHSTVLTSSALSPLETSPGETSFNTSQSNSNDELSTMLESGSALISSMMLTPDSSAITFSTPQSNLNDELSTMPGPSSAVISSIMLEPDSSAITISALQPSSNEAFSTLLESRSADTSQIMLESGSSEAAYSSAEASSNVLVSSSYEIPSISSVTSSRETYISTPYSSSKVDTSSRESSFTTPKSSLNEVLSTILESITAVTSSIMLEPGSSEITSSALQTSSTEALSTMLYSRSADASPIESSSADISSIILDYSPSETSYISLQPGSTEASSSSISIDSFTSSLQTSEELSDIQTSISDEFDFGVSVTYYSTQESMSSTVLSSRQLPVLSLSPSYTLQPSSTGIQNRTLVISPTEVTSSTSSLESDFIDVSSSNLQPLSSMLIPDSTVITSSITEPSSTDMLVSTVEINPSVLTTESPITTVELSSSLITTTFEIQTSDSSVNVMPTTEISRLSSVTSTSEISLTPSPSLSPSSTQDIEMSLTFIPVITVRDTLIYQNEENLTLGCNITNTDNFTQIIFDVNGVEAGKVTRDLIEIEPEWIFRNESNSDKQIYLMTLEEANCTHSGNYTCSIGGDWGVVQQTATIEVRVAPGVPVVTLPDQIVEDQLLRQNITCSVDAGIPASMVTWSVEYQDGRTLENLNFNPTEETHSSESCINRHVSSFISTFNISWHNSSLCCNVDQGNRRTSTCEDLFVVPADYCSNRTDGLYDHPYDDCYVYVQCSSGTVYINSCPKGGAFCFDEPSGSCSKAAPTTTMDPSQASDPYSCIGKINFSYIPVRDSCKDYMWCVNGSPFPYVCPGDTYFFDTDPNQTCTNDINLAYCTIHNNE